jgi:hypothetical protein
MVDTPWIPSDLQCGKKKKHPRLKILPIGGVLELGVCVCVCVCVCFFFNKKIVKFLFLKF